MDKQTFRNLAPEYYMLALYMHLQYPQEYYTDASWRKEFSYRDDDSLEDYCYVENAGLRAEAVRLMLKHNAISIIEDPFGPTILQKAENLEPLAEQLEKSAASVFFRARASGDPKSWLYSALQKVNTTADEIGITRADFDPKTVADSTVEAVAAAADTEAVDEWAPITIDQTDPIVVEATKQLNAATEAIEQDNGYSVAHPQERDAVVGNLRGGLEKLKSGVVSTGWMRRTVWALKQASGRFANTMKGQMIDGALAAIKEVVKSQMGHLIDQLLSWWP
jgi:hypothetical protein